MLGMGDMMKQAKAMQEKMAKVQEQVAALEVTGESGAGLVRIQMTGRHDVCAVTIDPALMSEDREVLEDLIAAAAAAVGAARPAFDRVPTSALLHDTGKPDEWFFQWVHQVEPTLTEPTIVYDYPAWQAALARTRAGVADRFEVYLGGLELANAFHEELSADTLRTRWKQREHGQSVL